MVRTRIACEWGVFGLSGATRRGGARVELNRGRTPRRTPLGRLIRVKLEDDSRYL